MNRRFALLLFALACALLVAGVTSWALGAGTSPTQHFQRLSNQGQSVDLSGIASNQAIADQNRSYLTSMDVRPNSLRSLGTRNQIEFYRAVSTKGGDCFILGTASQDRIGYVACSTAADSRNGFPNDSTPIRDVSVFRAVPGVGVRVAFLQGFAADGVTTVGVVKVDGSIETTDVLNNVYADGELNKVDATAIVARDEHGKEVYRQSLED